MRRGRSRRVRFRCACFAAAVSAALTPGRAAPPPPPGGHHALYFGGDNRGGYPTVALTDAAEPTANGLPAFAITIHPNPFRGETTLRLALRGGQAAHLAIYNLAGRRVREFVQAAQKSGWQEITWDGRDAKGKTLPAGAYVYRAEAGGRVLTGKLTLLH